MRILFDQGTPVPIRRFLEGHEIRTAAQERWDTLENGDLLEAAETAGFDVLLTTDQNLRYQQKLSGRRIAIVVLRKQQWPDLLPHVQIVVDAVNGCSAGSFLKTARSCEGLPGTDRASAGKRAATPKQSGKTW